MKKLVIISVAAAALLFVGCKGKPAEANTTEANATTVETNATAAAPEANTTAAAPEANATAAAAPAADEGKTLFTACAACHGVDGKTAALGKSNIIAGQAKDVLVTKMKGYKAGTINLTGNGALMKGQMANLNDEQMEKLAEFVSKL
ncbi:MAG: c-type cytochrome [Sulfurovaceae bacterium]|nr:c-type cytochrome [Sulfurovaceae bacterium]